MSLEMWLASHVGCHKKWPGSTAYHPGMHARRADGIHVNAARYMIYHAIVLRHGIQASIVPSQFETDRSRTEQATVRRSELCAC